MLQASHIPPFFVAFCVTPLASNASELVSSLYFASRKHMKNISLTFCQVARRPLSAPALTLPHDHYVVLDPLQ